MIRECRPEDTEALYTIINEAAKAYQGRIPPQCYHEPYMPQEELRAEMRRITFCGWEEKGALVGVMGMERVEDTTLIRHAYVLPHCQGRGVGSKLLAHLKGLTTTPRLLVGTWADVPWAIDFYQKHGFRLLSNKDELLTTYWNVPARQREVSVVLGLDLAS